jgi:hypothetical protein
MFFIRRNPAFREFALTEHNGNVILFTVLDELRLGEPVSLYLADPEEHTFAPEAWNAIGRSLPATAKPVASSSDNLLELLETVKGELERRQTLFHQAATVQNTVRNGIPPKDLDVYNSVASTPLPRVMLVVDEANSYLNSREAVVQILRF